MGRRAKLTERRLLDAIAEHRGNLVAMAEALECAYSSVYEAVHRYEPCTMALYHQQQARFYRAQAKLDEAIARGERWAIMCVMSGSIGRRNGYGSGDEAELLEKIEHLEQQTLILQEALQRTLAQLGHGQ